MVNLTKKRKPNRTPVALTPYKVDLQNHIELSSPEAVAIAESIRTSMDRMTGLVQAVMTEQQRFLELMGVQQKTSNDMLAALIKQKPMAPIVNLPARSKSFQVDIEKDNDGATTGMQITAAG